MKRHMALGIALAMILASTGVEAQLRGLIRKKAEEMVGKKPEPAKPAAAPAPAPETPAPAPPASTSAAPVTRDATPAAARTAVSPLDVSVLPVSESATTVLRGRVNLKPNGDWDRLPYIPDAATTAAYGLGDAARAALVETVGAALKALVSSAAFQAEHEQFIKREFQAVDHGLKGVVTIEDALKKNDLKAIEAIQLRQVIAMGVDQVRALPPDYIKQAFQQELADWQKSAANAKLRDRAKYQKLVARAQPLEALPANDETFVIGYAVLKSIDNDGPDTAEAVMAIHARVRDEKEQAAWDGHNLNVQLRQQLSTFVAIASKVNFDAPTAQKNGHTVFVNAADERQGAIWKACFRAGEGPTAAALKVAKAWLAEM